MSKNQGTGRWYAIMGSTAHWVRGIRYEGYAKRIRWVHTTVPTRSCLAMRFRVRGVRWVYGYVSPTIPLDPTHCTLTLLHHTTPYRTHRTPRTVPTIPTVPTVPIAPTIPYPSSALNPQKTLFSLLLKPGKSHQKKP